MRKFSVAVLSVETTGFISSFLAQQVLERIHHFALLHYQLLHTRIHHFALPHRFALYNDFSNGIHMYCTGFLTGGRANRQQGLE